ncbi:MAG: hypothetical protein NC089_03640 [Bacteroides sp.]|nr:hypothetical protein [Bacteroides sp.]MCM1549740.1 hypothetical protein [Clostridium sp.]
METIDELRQQKKQAETRLISERSRLSQLNEVYERLQTARDKIKNAETEYFSIYESAEIYTRNLVPGDWAGDTRQQYEDRIHDRHRQAVGAIIYDVCMDIEAIEYKMRQMQDEADVLNDSIYYWTGQAARYQNQIEWRIRTNGNL